MPVFHEGERAVQARANVEDRARRIGQSIDSTVPLMAEAFLLRQPMAILGGCDASGNVWASQLTGAPGFIRALDGRTVEIEAQPVAGDPLKENLGLHAELGLLVLDPLRRMRVRLNGKIIPGAEGAITLRTEQVYFNCPKYIQARAWSVQENAVESPQANRAASLDIRQGNLISGVDTFFIASRHPEAGMDASHRGGNPGFVHVSDARTLLWPDYSGNSMFQTLGNLEVDSHAGLLFVDFETGSTLQLSGKASVRWDAEAAGKFAGAERVVEFRIDCVVEIANATPLRWKLLEYSPFNPA